MGWAEEDEDEGIRPKACRSRLQTFSHLARSRLGHQLRAWPREA